MYMANLPPLLKTKLAIPPARASLVERQRLMTRMAAGLRRKLTLISAPPGFGKTTLLSAWRASAEGRDVALAWVSLDDGDNDPARFWTYVTAALDALGKGLGAPVQALLRSSPPPAIEVMLTELINTLANVPHDVVLALDDYHVITTPAIHTALTFLIDHLPPQLHLIIAGRTDPLLPLARWRVRGDLLELRATDLQFTTDEAATFLREVMGLDLSAEAVALLEMRTEGWIAGLQIAALSLQGIDNAADFLSAFAGSHRHIADYLTEEVLQRQPAHLKAFLLQTSILDCLCGPLCDAVLGLTLEDERPRTNDQSVIVADERPSVTDLPSPFVLRPSSDSYSRLILEELERAHLFLVPLDHERHWYRYHHLFADVLRYRLRQDEPERVATLHRRAAAWLEQHDLLPEALGHALAAGGAEDAARLVERMGPLQALARGESMTVQRWLDALPDAAVRARPALCLARARVLQRSAPAAVVEQWLQEAERGLARLGASAESEGERVAAIRGESAALRAYMAMEARDLPRAIEQCHVALDQLPAEDRFARASLQLILGLALTIGNADAASEAFAAAGALGRQSGNVRAIVMSLCNQGLIHVARGELPSAATRYREAMQLGNAPDGHPLPVAQAAYRLLGDLMREWNDLDGAERLLTEATAIAERHRLITALPVTYRQLAQIQQTRGEAEAALATLQRAQALVRTHNLAGEERLLAAKEAEIQLRQGDLAAAARWASTYTPLGDRIERIEWPRDGDAPLIYARVRMSLGRPDEALGLLTPLMRTAERHGQIDRVIKGLAIQALACAAHGDTAQAIDCLGRALTLAEPGSYIRVFVDEGAPMADLVAQSAKRFALCALLPTYIEHLLSEFPEPQQPVLRSALDRSNALVKQLTERETEVLRLLAAGLASPEIAQHFVVSINTVKTQIKSIYGKLDAHSRAEAIAKARALHLLR
jgi:LuxR family maltose regulon positive regulatory protein